MKQLLQRLDAALVQQTLSGARASFELLVERHEKTANTDDVLQSFHSSSTIFRLIRKDGGYEIGDIPTGVYAVYFYAYHSEMQQTVDIAARLRFSSALVHIEPGQTTELSLPLP